MILIVALYCCVLILGFPFSTEDGAPAISPSAAAGTADSAQQPATHEASRKASPAVPSSEGSSFADQSPSPLDSSPRMSESESSKSKSLSESRLYGCLRGSPGSNRDDHAPAYHGISSASHHQIHPFHSAVAPNHIWTPTSPCGTEASTNSPASTDSVLSDVVAQDNNNTAGSWTGYEAAAPLVGKELSTASSSSTIPSESDVNSRKNSSGPYITALKMRQKLLCPILIFPMNSW